MCGRVAIPEARIIRNVMPRKVLYMNRHTVSLNMPTEIDVPLYRKYICCGDSVLLDCRYKL